VLHNAWFISIGDDNETRLNFYDKKVNVIKGELIEN
jgi:hypothetical protein